MELKSSLPPLPLEPLYQYVNYAQLRKSSLPYKSNGEPSNAAMTRMSMYETLGRRDSCGAVPGLGALRVKLWRDLEEVSGCVRGWDWSQQGLSCTCRSTDEEYVCLAFCSTYVYGRTAYGNLIHVLICPVEAGCCVGHLCRSYSSQSVQSRDATVSINSLCPSHTASTYVHTYVSVALQKLTVLLLL